MNFETITRDLGPCVRVGERAITLGFTLSTGKVVPVYLDMTADGRMLATDGGEAWSDLCLAGLGRPRPTEAQTSRLRAACRLHGTTWNAAAAQAEVVVSAGSELVDAARRLTSTAVAIDAMRLGLGATRERTSRLFAPDLDNVASARGWRVERGVAVAASHRAWHFDAKVVSDKRYALALGSSEPNHERVLASAMGMEKAIRRRGFVIVAKSRVVKAVHGHGLRRTAFVRASASAEEILDAAIRVAA
jgi:hypothetical protein